ncbi:MAG: hypothetical protein IJ802_05090 [Kiritimatiellae bacterium]|nr:hypothetical protein [Kiritimatiellia bacterium]
MQAKGTGVASACRTWKSISVTSPLAIAFALACAFSLEAFDSAAWLAERNDNSGKVRMEETFMELKEKGGLPAEDVTLPIERFASGKVRTRLHAARAWIYPDSTFVLAEGVEVERFKENGALEIAFKAEEVLADRKGKSIWVPGEANVRMEGVAAATGRGVYFSFEKEILRVYEATRIVTKALNLKMKDVLK